MTVINNVMEVVATTNRSPRKYFQWVTIEHGNNTMESNKMCFRCKMHLLHSLEVAQAHSTKCY